MTTPLLTVAEVAEYLRLREPAVRRAIRRGDLRGFKAGREWRVEPADLERFKVEQQNVPDPNRTTPRRGRGRRKAAA